MITKYLRLENSNTQSNLMELVGDSLRKGLFKLGYVELKSTLSQNIIEQKLARRLQPELSMVQRK